MQGAATKAMLDASGRSGNAADGPARLSAAAVALRPAAERFQQDRGPCPDSRTSGAPFAQRTPCGRKLDTTPASIFQQPASAQPVPSSASPRQDDLQIHPLAGLGRAP